MLAKTQDMGVIVVTGSDAGSCGVPHGVGLLSQLQQMESAGMSTMNVLRSATGISAASMLRFPEPIGTLAAFIVLSAHNVYNPLPAEDRRESSKKRRRLFMTVRRSIIVLMGIPAVFEVSLFFSFSTRPARTKHQSDAKAYFYRESDICFDYSFANSESYLILYVELTKGLRHLQNRS